MYTLSKTKTSNSFEFTCFWADANNYKKYGSVEGGGYIWHTTGSGKTLTSFKTARLASKLPYIDRVLFVVDRKDLDYQTMKEYDRFELRVTQDVTQDVTRDDIDAQIIKLITDNNKISTQKMAAALNVNVRTIKRHIKEMKNIRYVGRGFSGHWEIITEKK